MNAQKIISKIGELPTLPAVAARINTEIENENLSTMLLGEIITQDTALVSRILRLANSPFYGMPRQIASIDRAITILGFDTVKNLALSIAIFSFFQKGLNPTIDVTGLWNHSLGVAVSSRILVSRTNPKLAEHGFLLGIIHDAGKIALISQCLSGMEQVSLYIRQDGLSQEEAEVKVFGFTHQEIGALLIKEWKFPEMFVTGVRLHHDFRPVGRGYDEDSIHLTQALCVANQLAKFLELGVSTNPRKEMTPSVLQEYLGVDYLDLTELSAAIREDYQRIVQFWHMK